MMADIDIAAPLAALLFLSLCMAVVAAFAVVVHSLLLGKQRRARLALIAIGLCLGLYTGLLLGDSLFSKEYVLGRGVEKYFCELDCHLAYSVTSAGEQNGRWLVKLRSRFDEHTISEHRPREAPLNPNPRSVAFVDDSGRQYSPEVAHVRDNPPLSTQLRPGESYETVFVFAAPATDNPRLLLQSAAWPNDLLIGHENSPFHKKTYFSLREFRKEP